MWLTVCNRPVCIPVHRQHSNHYHRISTRRGADWGRPSTNIASPSMNADSATIVLSRVLADVTQLIKYEYIRYTWLYLPPHFCISNWTPSPFSSRVITIKMHVPTNTTQHRARHCDGPREIKPQWMSKHQREQMDAGKLALINAPNEQQQNADK